MPKKYMALIVLLALFIPCIVCDFEQDLEEYHTVDPVISLASEAMSFVAFSFLSDGKMISHLIIVAIFLLLLVMGQCNLFYLLSFANWLLFYAVVTLPMVARHCPNTYKHLHYYPGAYKKKASDSAALFPWSFRSDHVAIWATVSLTFHALALAYFQWYHDATPVVSIGSLYYPLVAFMKSGEIESNVDFGVVVSTVSTSFALTLLMAGLAALYYSCKDYAMRGSRS